MPGANSLIRSTTASPNASRWSSHVPSSGASLYGAYWTKQLMTCLPGGAIVGSTSVGMIMSMYGLRREAAVLRVVVGPLHLVDATGENEIAPRRCSPTPGRHDEVGQPVDGEVDLARRAAELEPADLGLELGVERARLDEREERPVGVDRRSGRRRPRSPRRPRATTPIARPSFDEDPLDRRLDPDLGAERPGRVADRVR